MSRKRPTAHRHLWADQGPRTRGGYRYVCSVCGGKSRNNLVQDPQFREPLRMTSVVLIGPDAGRVIQTVDGVVVSDTHAAQEAASDDEMDDDDDDETEAAAELDEIHAWHNWADRQREAQRQEPGRER